MPVACFFVLPSPDFVVELTGFGSRRKIGGFGLVLVIPLPCKPQCKGLAMAVKLTETEVRSWLRGQKKANEWIEAERSRVLLTITPEGSQRIYLSLQDIVKDGRTRTEPSPLLWKMREALEHYSGRKRKRPA